jgi:acetyltransferase-like isoleucine patch superfamily enzyme
MKNKKALPYYDSASFGKNLKASSKFRKQNILFFLFKKIRNYILARLAYTCPINNLRVRFHKWRGVHIGKNVFIGLRCTLDHAYPEYIYIEDNVILSGDIYIVAHNKPSVHFRRKIPSFVAPVIIKKNVFIGVRSTILPGVCIGKGSFVSGGSVISEKQDANIIVKGNPSQFIQKL